jgi:hypothetical protein
MWATSNVIGFVDFVGPATGYFDVLLGHVSRFENDSDISDDGEVNDFSNETYDVFYDDPPL